MHPIWLGLKFGNKGGIINAPRKLVCPDLFTIAGQKMELNIHFPVAEIACPNSDQGPTPPCSLSRANFFVAMAVMTSGLMMHRLFFPLPDLAIFAP
jgi:hypothetical protein